MGFFLEMTVIGVFRFFDFSNFGIEWRDVVWVIFRKYPESKSM
jgi:hypothetical protein